MTRTNQRAGRPDDGGRTIARREFLGRSGLGIGSVALASILADPKLFGYVTGQIFAVNGGMYMA